MHDVATSDDDAEAASREVARLMLDPAGLRRLVVFAGQVGGEEPRRPRDAAAASGGIPA